MMGSMTPNNREGFTPGLLLLQDARLEGLARMVLGWLAQYPAAPLETDTIIVPSNGVGEWFKAEAARRLGVCASITVDLPARFAARTMRHVLGRDRIPLAGHGLFDKSVLMWRLLQRRALEKGPGFVANLDDHHWCRDVADLFDHYQIYREDWLDDWSCGRAQLRRGPLDGAPMPIPEDQVWQAQLWRELVASREPPGGAGWLGEAAQRPRTEWHRRTVRALHAPHAGQSAHQGSGLGVGRVVVFGCGHLAPPVLELLIALSRHRRVVLAVPNPCREQWVDIEEGPGATSGMPLLAAWGRQVRDFVRQIELVDDRLAALEQRAMVRSDIPDESASPGTDGPPASRSALAAVQSAVEFNEAPSVSRRRMAAAGLKLGDGSIRMHRAHTALREVEALHDHLLDLLGHGRRLADGRPLAPRDVVVMVPDVAAYAPAIRAVFGRIKPDDPRHIPWGLADLRADEGSGLATWIDWWLSLPRQRATLDDLNRLLSLPMLQRRWGLEGEQVLALQRWAREAGVGWGLNVRHRQGLGLGDMGGAHTWRFGVDRMLAGVAWGHAEPAADLAPLAQVQGLAASAAGQFAGLLSRLEIWLEEMQQPAPAAQWCGRLRKLAADLLQAGTEEEEAALKALEAALQGLCLHSQAAAEVLLEWPVFREAVLAAYVEPSPKARFRAAGVTFCTLMPLRTVPFEVVCLLGMNDGAYPRSAMRAPGDLMTLPGLARPGDRSRRDDDRQLMLDALMSARSHLLVSWIGRRVQDNQVQPPSVVVGQWRDALTALWDPVALAGVTLDLPLQPFSPRHFAAGSHLRSYAHEWHAARAQQGQALPADPASAVGDGVPPNEGAQSSEESAARVEAWLVRPVAALLEHVLGVAWPRSTPAASEEEPLDLKGWAGWSARGPLLASWLAETGEERSPSQDLDVGPIVERLRRQGRLPLGAPGRQQGKALEELGRRWGAWVRSVVGAAAQAPAVWEVSLPGEIRSTVPHAPATWVIGGIVQGNSGPSAGPVSGPTLIRFLSGGLTPPRGRGWRDEKLVLPWWHQMVLTASGRPVALQVIAPDAWLYAPAPSIEEAVQAVRHVLTQWHGNHCDGRPWPADASAIRAALGSGSDQLNALKRLAQADRAWRRVWGGAPNWRWEEGPEAHAPAADPLAHPSTGPVTHRVADWADATRRIYAPYIEWSRHSLRESEWARSGQEPA